MAKVKSMERVGKKWETNASNAQSAYTDGVQNPRTDWATATAAAETAYQTGVQNAITKKRFGSGVKKAGTAAWQKGAIEKGPTRFAQGVQGAQEAYKKGFEPYHTVLSNIQLPARVEKGNPANLNRVAAVANALHAEKLKRIGG